MLLQLGDDDPGHGYIEHFKKMGVETKNIKLLKTHETGIIKPIYYFEPFNCESLNFSLFRSSIHIIIEGW